MLRGNENEEDISLYRFLSLKNGISQALAKRIILDIVEWFTVNIITNKKVNILKLGAFTLNRDSNNRVKVTFTPYKSLLDIIKEHK